MPCLVGRPNLMCHWQDALKYYRRLANTTGPLLDEYTEESVARYLIGVEQALRGHVVDRVRDRDEPANWGEALVETMERHTEVWNDNMHILLAIKQSTQHQGVSSGSGDTPAQQQQQQQLKPKGCLVCTLQEDEQGRAFCKRYQDNRGCAAPCKVKLLHACDIELDTGKPCSRAHSRAQHDVAKHGRPKYRTNN